MAKPALGVCYYPEHWPRERWSIDAAMMADLGLEWVRVGEFAWSRLEPDPGDYQFDWLEDAIDCLHRAGLKIVLGTPTATPPKWLVDRMPDMLAVGADGQTRKFGSRRHYCFSHTGYRDECVRIVTALAKRFAAHPGVLAWQTDNEYGCHDTVLSYSEAARVGFQGWLQRKYQSPQALNRAWGNVFWSMEYRSFDEIDCPAGTVTEANPAHRLDFHRYSSDCVVDFNRLQTDIIRAHAPDADIIHNFMGRILSFDHFALGKDLDVSSWDSYPLGFLEDRIDRSDDFKRRYSHAGDPDFQAFHHDLYRATGKGRWWVMEQQPGPVNWAPHNPAPRAGMVRTWAMEAFAHGAEVVSFFRWRQAPFAQEQMHAGLLRPDGEEAEACDEIRALKADLDALLDAETTKSKAAIVFDYESAWAWSVQPQGAEFDYFSLVFDFYVGARRLGLSLDILPSTTSDLTGYDLVIIPGLFTWPETLIAALQSFEGTTLIGPRSGSKTPDFCIPDSLPPDLPKDLMDFQITRVETLRRDNPVPVDGTGGLRTWREFARTGPRCETLLSSEDGHPVMLRQGNHHYVTGWPQPELMLSMLEILIGRAGFAATLMPEGVRLRRLGNLTIAINYSDGTVDISPLLSGGNGTASETSLPPASYKVIRT